MSQTPILEEAKKRGVYCITVDNVPANPGHRLGNQYISVSTIDRERVLEELREEKIDAIISYASDIATSTAAYVAESLGLKTNSLRSITSLTDKEFFRSVLEQTGLNTPRHLACTIDAPVYDYLDEVGRWGETVIVKPSDSAGTKGVSQVEPEEDALMLALNTASQFSNNGKLVIEQFISNKGGDVHGDGFVRDGELIFLHLGDHMYDYAINGLNPVGTTWPSVLPANKTDEVHKAVQKILTHVGFNNGPVNVEARFDEKGNLYVMEIGPRNGGYFVPLAIKLSSGFDLVSSLMDQLLDIPVVLPEIQERLPVAYYAVHAREKGILQSVTFSSWLKDRIVRQETIKTPGSEVERFVNSSQVISVLLLRFNNETEMANFASSTDNHISVVTR